MSIAAVTPRFCRMLRTSLPAIALPRPLLSPILTVCLMLMALLSNAYAADVSLAWDASTSTNVSGYRLHYGSASGVYTANVNAGNQTTSTVINLTPGQTYYFATTAYDAQGNQSAFSNEVTHTVPLSAPVASFSATPTSGTAPLTVTFTDTSTGTSTARAWDFGDGTTSTVQHPSHTYTTAGSYTVRLTSTGPGGSHTLTRTNYISTTVAPIVANFTGTPTTGTASLVVTFSNTTTGSATSWAWDFGNGSTSTAQHPSATYTTAGTYTVRLTATGPGGSQTVTKTNYITATVAAPVASFTGTPTTGTAPLAVTFSDTSTGSVTSWAWDFGNGSTSTVQHPSHTYATAGTYTVRLTVSGANGTDTLTRSNLITVSSSTGLVAAYGFENGSGTSVSDASGNDHTGAINGATWSTQGKFSNALSFNGLNNWVTVNASSLLNLTTGMTLEAWVFPTATTGTRDIIIKEGATVDIYNLYARNWRGLPEANVFVGGTNRVAEGTALPANVWTHVACTYDGSTLRLYLNGVQVASTALSGTIPPSTEPLRIGGNSLWGEFFQGLIDEVRIYDRALTAAAIQVDMQTPVSTPTALPAANFTGTPTTGTAPLAVTFSNITTGSVTTWAWDFGDGSTSTVQHPSHTYTTAGTYTVRLTATGAGGSHTVTKTNYISVTVPPPVANFMGTPTTGMAPLAVTFSDTTTGSVTTWAWDFGDGSTSTAQHPSHTYTTARTYTVRLTATGPGGSHTATKANYISVTPSILEVGEVQVDHVWKPVTFRQLFVAPIIVANAVSRNDSAPATVRIRNVTTTGFEVRVEEWNYLDGIHAVETVGYLVLERGRHTIDGVQVEAGSLQTSWTKSFGTVTFSQPFAVAPVVLTAVVSAAEATTVTTRMRNITATNFQVRMQEQEKNTQSHVTETLTYIAWQPSVGMLGSLHFEVQKTAQVMTDAFRTIQFTAPFMDLPVFLAAMQTTSGSDPAAVRWENKDFFGVDVQLQEEQSKDVEMTHGAEIVGYLALASTDGAVDTDGDGLTNVAELNQYGTDPAVADTDRDGLNDGDEVAYWSTNWQADSDGDGLINLLDPDSDGDGILDGAE